VYGCINIHHTRDDFFKIKKGQSCIINYYTWERKIMEESECIT
jgi:hypothetical protein